jgi:dTDP-4-dehydrorhamnose 3,5-epimerase
MRLLPTQLAEVMIIEPQVFTDHRGYLFEAFSPELAAHGVCLSARQINRATSRRGVLRGLHYQVKHPQAKLVQVLRGRIYDVAVDLRDGSSTRGHWTAVVLSAENRRQLYIPPGFAHGFYSFEENEVLYLLSNTYAPDLERGARWDDPALGIKWPCQDPIVSARDAAWPSLTIALEPPGSDERRPFPVATA